MLSDEQLVKIKPRVLVMQLVAVMMFIGAAVFFGLVISMSDQSQLGEPTKMLNVIAAATAVVMYGIAFGAVILFPRLPDKVEKYSADRPNDDEETKLISGILALLTNEIVVRYALFEGGIFLNAMVFMLEPRWISLIIGGLGFVLMLLFFPLKFSVIGKLSERVDDWRKGR